MEWHKTERESYPRLKDYPIEVLAESAAYWAVPAGTSAEELRIIENKILSAWRALDTTGKARG